MPTINQLSAVDSLSAGDNLVVYVAAQGDARRSSLTTLVSFLTNAFTSLTVSSYVKVTPVLFANLPAAATAGAGAKAHVTDSTTAVFAAAISGGGANSVPCYSDGAAWRVG